MSDGVEVNGELSELSDEFDALISAAPEPTIGAAAEDFFDGQQLLAQTLARHVQSEVQIGRLKMQRDTIGNDALWYYDRCGVWRPGGQRMIEWACNKLLGERIRPGHIEVALIAIRNMETMPNIDDGPPHPDSVNFVNGMYDWKLDEFTEGHHPDHHSTVQMGVRWNADAVCPIFNAWIRDILPEDCWDYIDEIIGYVMMNGNPLQKAVLLYGAGRNGKGTLLRIIKDVIGLANITAISLQQLTENRFAPASLHMKLADIAGDIHGGHIEQTNIFKTVTGDDVFEAERKNQQSFRFASWAVPMFSANKIPTSSDTSQGYINRWEVIPFTRDLTKVEGGPNPTIENSIRGCVSELEGVAVRGMRGLRRLMERGHFPRPPSVQEAFNRFVEALDPVRSWMAECTSQEATELGEAPWTYRTFLHMEHSAWREKNGHGKISAKAFYEKLEMAGLKSSQRSKQRGYNVAVTENSGIQVTEDQATAAAKLMHSYDVHI